MASQAQVTITGKRSNLAKQDTKFVVALDIGTAYSSYAYAVKRKSKAEGSPDIILKKYEPSSAQGFSRKAPSSVLLATTGEFVAFGYEAEHKYIRMSNEERTQYMLFKNIKKHLADLKDPDINIKSTDELKSASLQKVFTHLISHLKKDIMETLARYGEDIAPTDVSWIVSVPAIWSDIAKTVMKGVCYKAGLPLEHITLMYEPEAAAIWCSAQTFLIGDKRERNVGSLAIGTQFVTLDLGGCTIDISVQEVKSNGRMELLMAPSGGDKGGIAVDNGFEILLNDTFGTKVMEELRLKHGTQFMNMLREFETQKRGEEDDIRINLPKKLMDISQSSKDESKKDIYGVCIDDDKDQMILSKHIFVGLFNESIACIQESMEQILRSDKCRNATTLILVGGLSESNVIREFVQKSFAKRFTILQPPESDLAVLRGAVKFGLDPEIVTARISRYTYGIARFEDFDPAFHNDKKKVLRGDKLVCKDVFSKKFTIGDSVKIGTKVCFGVKDTFNNREEKKRNPLTVPIYKSTKTNPKYTDEDGSEELCKIIIPAPPRGWPDKVYGEVTFEVGRTELVATFKDKSDGRVRDCKFEFM